MTKKEEGILLKFSGPWRADTGVDEHFLPMSESIYLADLIEKLGKIFGEGAKSRNDRFVCILDERTGPRALGPEDSISPGSTLLFLGIVESG